jgi:hypothetical protein
MDTVFQSSPDDDFDEDAEVTWGETIQRVDTRSPQNLLPMSGACDSADAGVGLTRIAVGDFA